MKRKNLYKILGFGFVTIALASLCLYLLFCYTPKNFASIYPGIMEIEDPTITMGYWPSTNDSPFHSPWVKMGNAPQSDYVIELQIPKEEFVKIFSALEVRREPFKRIHEYAYVSYRDFFFTFVDDAQDELITIILGPNGQICCVHYNIARKNAKRFLTGNCFISSTEAYDAFNDYLTEYVRNEGL